MYNYRKYTIEFTIHCGLRRIIRYFQFINQKKKKKIESGILEGIMKGKF